MKIKNLVFILTLAAIGCVALLAGCGGGGGGDGGGGGGGSSGAAEAPVADQLATAKDILASGDIEGAAAAYTAVIGSEASAQAIKATDSGGAEARFGRALCNLILLIEKDPSTAILAGFGQGPWKTSDVFGSGGYFALSLTERAAANRLLPFYNVSDCWLTRHERCILSRMAAGYTEETLASSLNDLMASVDPVISDLKVAIEEASASYTIPKELYSGDIDMPVNHADMVAMLAGLYMTKAGSDFANSWTFNIDLSTLVGSAGTSLLTRQQIVDLLNEQFGLRADNRLASARINMQSSLDYARQALSEVTAGASGGILNLSDTNGPIFQEMYDMASSARVSFDGDASIIDIEPAITANVDNFFKNPADGGAVQSDPFVLQGKRIHAVEAYWQQMISSACNFTIGTKGAKVFSATVRQISRPYYQIFNAIMGHTFGRHRAGRGA